MLIFPNQLFKQLPNTNPDRVILLEDRRFFSDFNFHKKKLVLHRASLKYYQKHLEKRYKVSYIEHNELLCQNSLGRYLTKEKIHRVYLFDPVDHELQKRLKNELNEAGIAFTMLESELFICSNAELKKQFKGNDHLSMNSFYIRQRKNLNILLENGKAKGGKWSFDAENRLKLAKNTQVPQLSRPKSSRFAKEAISYVDSNFQNNPGSTDGFFYPVTHNASEKWFRDFIENRLDLFGPYEDSISKEHCFLFHSLISPLLNAGLLKAEKIIKDVIEYSESNPVRLNSLEGFVRQVIGWREFIRAAYILRGGKQARSNSWGFRKHIPQKFYDATTGIEPVDHVIKGVMKNAYCHHIERLMVLGNFMLLCEIDPKEVYRWFMELFIDAYGWVMVPNVFGMSQYADGGLMTTKPYISSSNYIRKMSDFKTGQWCEIWDSLFWRFICKHKQVFAENPRMKIMAIQAEKMGKEKTDKHIIRAEAYLKELFSK